MTPNTYEHKSNGYVMPILAIGILLTGALLASYTLAKNKGGTVNNVKSSHSIRVAVANNPSTTSGTNCAQYDNNKSGCTTTAECKWTQTATKTCGDFTVASCPSACNVQTSAGTCANGGTCAGQNKSTCESYGQACSAKSASTCTSTPGCSVTGGCKGGAQCTATTANACTGKGYCSGASACSQYTSSSACRNAPSGYNCKWNSYNCSWSTPSCTGTSPGCSWSAGYDYCAGNAQIDVGRCEPKDTGETPSCITPEQGCSPGGGTECCGEVTDPSISMDTCNYRGTIGRVCRKVVVHNPGTCIANTRNFNNYAENVKYYIDRCAYEPVESNTGLCTGEEPLLCPPIDLVYVLDPGKCGTPEANKVCPRGYKAVKQECAIGQITCAKITQTPGTSDTKANDDSDGDGLRNWNDPDSKVCVAGCFRFAPNVWPLSQ